MVLKWGPCRCSTPRPSISYEPITSSSAPWLPSVRRRIRLIGLFSPRDVWSRRERALCSPGPGRACVIAADSGETPATARVQNQRDDGVVNTGGSTGGGRRLFRVEDLPGSEPWAWRSGFAEGRCVASNMKGVVAVADDDGLELRTGAGEARGSFRGEPAYDAAAMAFLADGQRLVTAARGARAAVVWDAARETSVACVDENAAPPTPPPPAVEARPRVAVDGDWPF